MRKRPLQLATVLTAFIPVVTGALTLLGLDDPLYRDMETVVRINPLAPYLLGGGVASQN